MEQYHQKIGSLHQELAGLYDEVLDTSSDFEITLNGKQKVKIYETFIWSGKTITKERISTFSEQMEFIRIYLKCLGGKPPSEELTKEEMTLFKLTDLMDGLVWYNMADYMESLIQWLNKVINQY